MGDPRLNVEALGCRWGLGYGGPRMTDKGPQVTGGDPRLSIGSVKGSLAYRQAPQLTR